MTTNDIDTTCVNTIRTLCIDAVQQARSGHPGTPMAMAPVVYELWQNHLRFDPDDPIWPNRDRFVLSAGHASTLLYSILHLVGVKAVNPAYETLGELSVPLEDLERFRQLDSRCPGHPEYRWTSGVETTTGPLGNGVATSVGMAIAGQWQAATFNRPGFELFDYDVYALAGDGCMMEGISGEAASLAAHLRLANLCWIYDSNHITIEGSTALALSENVEARFAAYGWHVTRVTDANDLAALGRAFEVFRAETERPTLVIVDSHIGYGSPHKHDTSAAHGEPLGEEEVRETKRAYGWPEDARFLVPDGVREHIAAGLGARGKAAREAWMARFEAYRAEHPEQAEHVLRMQRRELPDGWDRDLPVFEPHATGLAGREASAKVLNAIAPNVPWLIGGAADLAPSTKTRLTFDGAGDFSAEDRTGRNLHFGIREHAMGAILNGLSLSKLRPFGSGFLIFSDYARTPTRLSADHGDPDDHDLHPRLDRSRGRWPHAPADRAAAGAAGDARAGHAATGRRERGRRELAADHAAPARPRLPRPLPPGDGDARPLALRAGLRGCPGRLRPRGPGIGRARGDPDRDGNGGPARRRRLRGARRRGSRGARRLDAIVGAVRAPAACVPRARAAARRDRADRDRAGLDVRLGALRRQRRPGDRDDDLRRVRAAQGSADEVRIHAGRGRGRRPRARRLHA